LAAGTFYPAAGPRLDGIARDEGAIEIDCSPCRSVTLVSGKSIGSAVNAGRLGYVYGGRVLATDDQGLVLRARLDVPPAARHVRVEITDAAGRKAGSNPIGV